MLLFLTLPQTHGLGPSESLRSPLFDMARALAWATKARAAIAMVAIGAVVSALLMPYLVLMPVVARDLIGGTAADLGLLIAAGGVGVLISAALVPIAARHLGQGRLMVATIAAAATGIAGLGLSSSFLLSAAFGALVAAATNTFGVVEGLLLQTMTPPPIRGRVLAIDGVIFNIANPLGILGAGLLVDQLGARTLLVGMAALCLLGVFAILLLRRPVVILDVDDAGELVDARRAVRAEEPAPAPDV
jgi:predicted MFS family arabinose efflux permease